MRTITDKRAKQIASEWHGGQNSALYQFASSGQYLPENHLRYLWEVQRSILHSWFVPYEYDLPKKDEVELNKLKRYFTACGLQHGIETKWVKHFNYGYEFPQTNCEKYEFNPFYLLR